MTPLLLAFALCRALAAGAVAVLFGAGAMLALGGSPRLELETEAALRRVFRLAGIVGLAATLCLLPLQAASIAGDWHAMFDEDMLDTVILQTRYGQVWIVRAVAAAALLGVVLGLRPGSPSLIAGVAALALAPLALSGHAAMHEGWLGLAHALNDFLHVLAAAFWLGSLPVFLLWLAAWRRPAWRRDATRALLRFSAWGHVAVAVLLLSGVANAALILGPGLPDPASGYVQVLLVKALLALAMTGLALRNRYRWIARIRTQPVVALRAIRRNTLWELALGALVLAVAGLLGLMSPH
ncbi:MAG: copper homeostasis membrane protein CopD [Achromobacter sp.]|jgi:putative copper resistance protein D|uniref:Inner membrane protein YebZ n=3 Tax=Achromobacter TaxID=222 RepID=A0A6J5AUZ7_9BURK|nr:MULTISPECIES: copper homeostasis membrane protein CopD [Achromobacter]MBN9638392.1 copper homeostasis membrane protein CopD [Achromobacter sp.]MCG2598457.1 copper homeostasis membrane protein CopD [Achromobacter sp.]MCG2604208.1 copper homeostasis membrane protein CopD [Achromobacter sp.]CAB3679699.1 Inner membrane protein YebZ [Achromobacter insuavis]CUI95742.1 Inner membrane protein YebZ [Achromobacter sp. 2789STDY5608633]